MNIHSNYQDREFFVHQAFTNPFNQVGEHCQAIYSVDGQYHDAKIEEINADGEVSVKFKGFR